MQTASFAVDGALLDLVDALLLFTIDGPTGSKVLLDNIGGLSIANADFQAGTLTGWLTVTSGAGSAGVAEIPIAPALPLLATAIGGLGAMTVRKRRKAATVGAA
jgi:hypothetical protein